MTQPVPSWMNEPERYDIRDDEEADDGWWDDYVEEHTPEGA